MTMILQLVWESAVDLDWVSEAFPHQYSLDHDDDDDAIDDDIDDAIDDAIDDDNVNDDDADINATKCLHDCAWQIDKLIILHLTINIIIGHLVNLNI